MLETTGRVLHNPMCYDFTVWLFTGGKERRFRERVVSLADLASGEAVLDIGCGTGSQAIAAKRRVGADGSVKGLDASPEMLDRARAKARKTGAAIQFELGTAEALPYRDGQFDVVLSIVMMHHLPKKARATSIAEVRRVLKPGGRFLVLEFEGTAEQSKGLVSQIRRHKHGHVANKDMLQTLEAMGLSVEKSGAVGLGDMHFTLATAPCR